MKVIKERADLPATDEVYIFGAGRGGRIVFAEMKKLAGAKTVAFIDNQKRGALNGLPILSFDEFVARRTEHSQIVIASMFAFEMAAQLRRKEIQAFYNALPLIQSTIEKEKKQSRMIRAAMTAAAMAGIAVWLFV